LQGAVRAKEAPMATRVSQLATTLDQELGSKVAFNSVATRVLLRTGVNILDPRDADADPKAIAKVWSALVEMGYRLSI
jgi:hypothetical protein